MSYFFQCKFCKKNIIDNYIDKRKAPIYDDIYHKVCYNIILDRNIK